MLPLLAVLALVFINGFFVAAEFALVTVRDTQLTPLVARGSRRARVASTVLKNLDSSLSACQPCAAINQFVRYDQYHACRSSNVWYADPSGVRTSGTSTSRKNRMP